MAEMITCGVPRCGRKYLPGHGGRGGDDPKCPMHLKREARNSKNQDDPSSTKQDRGERLTIRLDKALLRWVKVQARAAGLQASSWIYRLLNDKRVAEDDVKLKKFLAKD